MTPAESVLILRFSAVGDVVLTSPAVDALRRAWPKARIVYAVKARLAHLVRANPNIDEVLTLDPGEGPFSFARKLRAARCETVLDLHNKIRSKILRALLPSRRTVVWHKRDFKDTLPVKLALKPYHSSMLFSDRYHAAVEELVGSRVPRGELRYFLGPDDLANADQALMAAGVSRDVPILGLSPGANWKTKRWPVERFAALANRALRAGMQVVVQGSHDEADLSRFIAAHAPGAVDLAGKLDLPTLAMFGSTDPAMFEFTGHRALFAGVECSPCSFFGRSRCPRGHFRCMLDLDEERAWTELVPLLTGGRRAPLSA